MTTITTRYGTFDLSAGPDYSRATALEAQARARQGEAQRIQEDYNRRIAAQQANIDYYSGKSQAASTIAQSFYSSAGNSRAISSYGNRAQGQALDYYSSAMRETQVAERLQQDGQQAINQKIMDAQSLATQAKESRESAFRDYNRAIMDYNAALGLPRGVLSSKPSSIQNKFASFENPDVIAISKLQSQGYTPIASMVGGSVLGISTPATSTLPETAREASSGLVGPNVQRPYEPDPYVYATQNAAALYGGNKVAAYFGETFGRPSVENVSTLTAGGKLFGMPITRGVVSVDENGKQITTYSRPFGDVTPIEFVTGFVPGGVNPNIMKTQRPVQEAFGTTAGFAAGVYTIPFAFAGDITKKLGYAATKNKLMADVTGLVGSFGGGTFYSAGPKVLIAEAYKPTNIDISTKMAPKTSTFDEYSRIVDVGPKESGLVTITPKTLLSKAVLGTKPLNYSFQGAQLIEPAGGASQVLKTIPKGYIVQDVYTRGTLTPLQRVPFSGMSSIDIGKPAFGQLAQKERLVMTLNESFLTEAQPSNVLSKYLGLVRQQRLIGGGFSTVRAAEMQPVRTLFEKPINVYSQAGEFRPSVFSKTKPSIDYSLAEFSTYPTASRSENIFFAGKNIMGKSITTLPGLEGSTVSTKPIVQKPVFSLQKGFGSTMKPSTGGFPSKPSIIQKPGGGLSATVSNFVETTGPGGTKMLMKQIVGGQSQSAVTGVRLVPALDKVIDTSIGGLAKQSVKSITSGAVIVGGAIAQGIPKTTVKSYVKETERPIGKNKLEKIIQRQTPIVIPKSSQKPSLYPPTEKTDIFQKEMPRTEIIEGIDDIPIEEPRLIGITRLIDQPRPIETGRPYPITVQQPGFGKPPFSFPIFSLPNFGGATPGFQDAVGERGGSEQGFDVFVKSGGKFVKTNKPSLSLSAQDAVKYGQFVVDNTVARSAVIRTSTKPASKLNRPLSDVSYKFSPPKNTKRFPQGTFTEKTQYAIDTAGEKRGLSVARFLKTARSLLPNVSAMKAFKKMKMPKRRK